MEIGILYVIFNKWIRNPETNEMPYKIGITRGTIEDRYYGLGLKMPGKFETVFAYQFEDCNKTEQLLHGLLNKQRENGEWFTITDEQLKLVRANCELMGGKLVTEEVENEIEIETENKEMENYKDIENINSPINPNFPCKVIMFNISRSAASGKSIYDRTRSSWKITEQYRDVTEYQYAVGLVSGNSLGGYKINNWEYLQENNRYRFNGNEVPELIGYSFHKQISSAMGYWQYGSRVIVGFDGRGKYQIISGSKENKDKWIDC
jgi:hypothetical protein